MQFGIGGIRDRTHTNVSGPITRGGVSLHE